MLDPFVALTAAADITSSLQLMTYVINAQFWNSLLLARTTASTALFGNGRFALGLGAGYSRAEFGTAGIAHRPADERVQRLALLGECLVVIFAPFAARVAPFIDKS